MVPIDYLAHMERVTEKVSQLIKQNHFFSTKKCTLLRKKSASKTRFRYLNASVKGQLQIILTIVQKNDLYFQLKTLPMTVKKTCLNMFYNPVSFKAIEKLLKVSCKFVFKTFRYFLSSESKQDIEISYHKEVILFIKFSYDQGEDFKTLLVY